MIFDLATRQYINRGRVVPASEIRAQLEEFIDEEKHAVNREANKVLAGTLALAAFFSFLREKIKSWHSISGTIAYGGRDQMSLERWKRINETVQKELAFLDKWRVEAERGLSATRSLASRAATITEADALVPSGLESVVQREVQAALISANAATRPVAVKEAVVNALADSVPIETAETVAASVAKEILESARTEELIWGSLNSRGKMYADSTYATYENSVKGRETDAGAIGVRRVTEGDDHVCDGCENASSDEYVSMDEILDIGSAECQNACRCEFEFSYLNIEPLTIEREIYA